MEDSLLTKIHSRLTAFRNEVVAKDMIVPAWVIDSIEEIEAAQHRVQRIGCTCHKKNGAPWGVVLHDKDCPNSANR